MKQIILFFGGLIPFALSAQVDCVDAKDCYLRGTQSIFDNSKIQFQNDCFTKAIAFDPNYVDAYHYRGGNFFRQEKYKEAIADYTKYIELIKLEPKQSKFVLAKIYYYRGESHLKLGNKKDALADYQKASEIFPKEEKYIEAYNQLKNKK